MFPGEVSAASDALEAINNNPYYGFSANLEDVKSTRYKSLTWVAKELLIRLKGEATLRDYAGFADSIPFKAEVSDLIEEFTRRKAQALYTAPQDAAVTAGGRLIGLATASTRLN